MRKLFVIGVLALIIQSITIDAQNKITGRITDKETGEETKHPMPDPLPFHRYDIVGPFNPQVKKIFRCTVGLGPTGQVEQVF